MSAIASFCLPETGRLPRLTDPLPNPRFSPDNESRRDNRAVRRGFSWLAAGNIVNAACSWGRLALLARIGNAEMIGQLTLALAVCNPISDFADLGLCGALITDVRRQFRLQHYLGLRAITCLLTLAVIAGTVLVGGYDSANSRLIMLAGVLVACESMCDIFQAVLQREERMHWVAVSLILRGIIGLALFAIITWSTHSLAWAVCGFSIAAVAMLLAIDLPRALACEKRRGRNLKFEISNLKSQIPNLKSQISDFRVHEPRGMGGSRSTPPYVRLAWLSLPLGLATASLSLTTSVPRYWISHRLGNTALGGFAVAGSLMIGLSLLVGALSQAACPRLARHHATGNRRAFMRLLGRLSLWLAVVTLFSVAMMAVAGHHLIGLLFGPAFVPYAAVATCLMLAAGLRNFSILLGRAITSMRRFRTGLALRLLGIAVLMAMLPGWIDWLGLLGAAWAVTLCWLITTLLSLAVVLYCIPHGEPACGSCAEHQRHTACA